MLFCEAVHNNKFHFDSQINPHVEKELNENINSVISKMDEVDEIDENHAESNDAFAAYVNILYRLLVMTYIIRRLEFV